MGVAIASTYKTSPTVTLLPPDAIRQMY